MTGYWGFVGRAAAVGFMYGFLYGCFLALWAWFTLGF